MSDDAAPRSPQTLAEPPLTPGSWAVLAAAWVVGLISWAFWAFLFGYALWRLFGGSPQSR